MAKTAANYSPCAAGVQPFAKLKTSCATCSVSRAPPITTILLSSFFCNTVTAQDCRCSTNKERRITLLGCIKLLRTRNMPRSAVPKHTIHVTVMQSPQESMPALPSGISAPCSKEFISISRQCPGTDFHSLLSMQTQRDLIFTQMRYERNINIQACTTSHMTEIQVSVILITSVGYRKRENMIVLHRGTSPAAIRQE